MPTIDYENPTTVRPRLPRIVRVLAITVGCLVLAGAAIYGGFVLLFFGMMWHDARVELTVTNHASVPADVTIRDHYRSTSIGDVHALAPGATESTSKHTGEVSAYVMRVQVGARSYEEPQGGALLADDGPHRFNVEVYDDRVVVTRRSNEGPYTYELKPPSPTTTPTKRRSRARRHAAPVTAPRQ